MVFPRLPARRLISLSMAACLIVVSCGGDDAATPQSAEPGSDPGSSTSDTEGQSGLTVVPADTGPLTDFELGGMTLAYDASYWEIQPFGTGDPDDTLVWFVSPSSDAAIQLSFTNQELDPADDVCDAGYAGSADPSRHEVTLLHQETLDNGGVLRIHEQDLDTSEDEPVVGISYTQLLFDVADGHQVGDRYCRNSRWIDVSERTRADGSPVHFRVEAFFAFTIDFVFAPFKEQFDSADALRQRDGFREVLALLETIEIDGTPVARS